MLWKLLSAKEFLSLRPAAAPARRRSAPPGLSGRGRSRRRAVAARGGRRPAAARTGRVAASSPGWPAAGARHAGASCARRPAGRLPAVTAASVKQRIDRQRIVGRGGLRVGDRLLRAAGRERGQRGVARVDRALRLPDRPRAGEPGRDGERGERDAAARGAPAGAAVRQRDVRRRFRRPRWAAAGDPRGAQSPATAVPGTNQVQSTAECTPNAIAVAASVIRPMRSGVTGACGRDDGRTPGVARARSSSSQAPQRRRGRTPVARAAAPSHAISSATLSPIPTRPRSASVCGT